MKLLRSKKRIFLSFIALGVVCMIVFLVSGYYSARAPISFLPPKLNPIEDSLTKKGNEIVIDGTNYHLMVDSSGNVSITTPDKKVILSSLTYFIQLAENDQNEGLQNVKVQQLNDSLIEIKGKNLGNVEASIQFLSHKNNSRIDVRIENRFLKKALVKRIALIASFNVPVSAVFTKNREVQFANFTPEYWLQSEGAYFGKGERSALIYHTPGISSLQLQTEKNLLFVNLDYYLDHPFVHLPYQKDGGGKWIDCSESLFKPGYIQTDSFSINVGVTREIPRLMLVPGGYKAGYVFTEHADGGTIKTQRAAYFGSEDVRNSDQATGGFAYYNIPVTKSVFYIGDSSYPGRSIIEKGKISPELNFLDQLYAKGNSDLCLHTPDEYNSNRKDLEDAIKFMKNRYNTISWIDHGFYGGRINRESMVCDGLDSLSPFYAADLWQKYDTKYFWSAAVEMINDKNWISVSDNLKKLKFYTAYQAFLKRYASPDDLKNLNAVDLIKTIRKNFSYRFEENTLEYNNGNALPTPLYWKNPTRTSDFYNWASDQEKIYQDMSDRIVQNENEQLDNLVKHQGIFINHGYFVRNRSDDRILKNVNGKLVINPNFDKILASISGRRSKGDLYVTTIRDLLNYWIKLEKVNFEYLPDGSIRVINNNDEAINGLSMIIKAKNISVDGKKPFSKASGGNTIFWFDIAPHQQVSLIIK